MGNLWIIYALVFGTVLFGVQAVYWLVFRAREKQSVLNRRLALNSAIGNPTEAFDALRRERGFADYDSPLLSQLSDYLVQTGLKVGRNTLVLYILGLACVLFGVFSLLLRLGPFSLPLAVLAAAGLSLIFLRRARRQRIAKFSEQLPDALDVIVRGVKVGHPFSTALGLVAKEMPDPIGTEFGMTADEVTFGADVSSAIENLCRRVGQEDLFFFSTAIGVQSKTGGNLGEILDRLSKLIRQRAKIRLKIRSLTAEGRLSAVFLTLVPLFVFAAVNLLAPPYYGLIWENPATMPTLGVALALLAIGNLVIRKMVNFKV